MTTFFLQENLKKELERTLKNIKLKDPNNPGSYTNVSVFEQALPKMTIVYDSESEEIEEDESEEPYPYVIIKLDSGKIVDENELITVNLYIAIYDDDLSNNGHMDILNIIQAIYERFRKDPMLANKYYATEDMEWVLLEDDLYPYFHGAARMEFRTRIYKKEDHFA